MFHLLFFFPAVQKSSQTVIGVVFYGQNKFNAEKEKSSKSPRPILADQGYGEANHIFMLAV